jgi:hypothetical protein
MTTRIKSLVAALAVLGVCSSAYAGELAELHKKTVGTGGIRQDIFPDRNKSRSEEHGITEIGLERTLCFGTCPAYTVIVKSDGTLRYKGERFVQKVGEHTGRVEVWQFNNLARFIKDEGYMDLKNTYSISAYDLSTTYSTVVVDGKRKIIKNYGNSGPTKLWAIEELIDKMVLEAQWDDEKKAAE